jgi:hypothetical protein
VQLNHDFVKHHISLIAPNEKVLLMAQEKVAQLFLAVEVMLCHVIVHANSF